MRIFVWDDEGGGASTAAERSLTGASIHAHSVWSEELLRARLEEDWSVILLSWSAPASAKTPSPKKMLDLLRDIAPELPCIVVAPQGISTEGAVLAMRGGAADVAGPEGLPRLGKMVERVLWRAQSERKVRAARTALADAQRASRSMARAIEELGLPNGDSFFRWAMETSNLGVWVIDPLGHTKLVNGRMAQMLRSTPPDIVGRSVLEFVDESEHSEMKRRYVAFARGESSVAQVRYRRTDGTYFLALLESAPIIDDAGRFAGGLAMVMDITAWRDAEEGRVASEARCDVALAQLRQSQKMEAVGRLAGGVAHDFNNMLSVILGYGDALIERVSASPDVRDDIEEIMTAGRRAADLTRQLLMFSRQHVVRPCVHDLAELIGGVRKMIERIVGEDIELDYPTTAFRTPPLVSVDRSGIEQVLLNLVVNARDAMPTGGKLTIGVGERGGDGDSLVLTVKDRGCGMDEATIARAFDPFFTTKEQGKGTGLGLSTAYGIVEQAGGTICIHSRPGVGTTFEVLLPRVTASAPDLVVAAPKIPLLTLGSRATILLVEDEDQVRAVTRRALERQGHRVLEARSPIEALLVDIRPSLKVLFMSGYDDDNVTRHGVALEHAAYLQKPFTSADLSKKVREVLDTSRSVTTGAA